MNTYDPADYILYVSMDGPATPTVSTEPSDLAVNRLPTRYANESPRTRLRSPAAVPPSQSNPQPPLAAAADRIALGEAACFTSAEYAV